MLIKDIDFGSYQYARICVATPRGPANFPPDSEETVKRLYGEETLEEENGVSVENNWLILKLEHGRVY